MKELPNHVAVIPDGNRRWARARGLIPWEGHREGAKRFREISEAAFRMGIPYFTFWAASEDNLTKRSKIEVRFLVKILREALRQIKKGGTLVEDKIRLRVIGKWREILKDKGLAADIAALEKDTEKFDGRHLTVLFGYDGRREMLEAIANLCYRRGSDAELNGPIEIRPAADLTRNRNRIDFRVIKESLWTGDLPQVDLVIRTGGEPHWSAGFMMWLCADSQFYFTEKFWPDFTAEEFKKALADYAKRERRFGQ